MDRYARGMTALREDRRTRSAATERVVAAEGRCLGKLSKPLKRVLLTGNSGSAKRRIGMRIRIIGLPDHTWRWCARKHG